MALSHSLDDFDDYANAQLYDRSCERKRKSYSRSIRDIRTNALIILDRPLADNLGILADNHVGLPLTTNLHHTNTFFPMLTLDINVL